MGDVIGDVLGGLFMSIPSKREKSFVKILSFWKKKCGLKK